MDKTIKTTGRFRRGLEITKSSWRVLRLDKELVLMPLMSGIVGMVAMIMIIVIWIASSAIVFKADGSFTASNGVNIWSGALLFIVYLAVSLIVNVFGAAIIHGAAQRFDGHNPTFRGSLRAAKMRFGSIAAFSLLSSTIGFILRLIEDRVPLAGKIVSWIFHATWSIASMFAVPVIVLGNKAIGPVAATKQSVNIVKKVWGESVVSQLGLGLIQMVYVLGWAASFAALMALLVLANTGMTVTVVLVVIFAIGLLAIGVIFSALSAIAKAAVYYYATTGKAPETFNKQLLQEAMTVKKARKIFA